MYANPMHRRHSFDNVELAYEPYQEHDRSTLDMETISDDSGGDGRVNVYIVFIFILEVLVLVFVSVLEYFLRETNEFPVRHVKFSCSDASISYTRGDVTFGGFAYHANVAYEVIIPLCFALPPFLILVSEIALCGFTEEPQKTIRALCRPCKVPQYVRRVIRYIGAFLFGLLVTMIVTDTAKLMTGRLRPTFLDACKPNATCYEGTEADTSFCTETDKDKIREGRLSFPSLQAAMTAYCAVFMAVYLHNVIRNSSVHILRPFLGLSFVVMSMLCGLARYGLHHNHWTDVLAGFLLGAVMAIYIGVFVLNNFRERMSSQRLYTKLRSFMAEQRALELRDFYKEPADLSSIEPPADFSSIQPPGSSLHGFSESQDRLDRNGFLAVPPPSGGSQYSGLAIPRPHVHANGQINESSTDGDFHFPPRDPDHHVHHSSSSELYQQQLHHRHHHSLPHADKRYIRERHLQHQAKAKAQNTFQRDLNKAIDQYRRGATPPPGHYHHGHM